MLQETTGREEKLLGKDGMEEETSELHTFTLTLSADYQTPKLLTCTVSKSFHTCAWDRGLSRWQSKPLYSDKTLTIQFLTSLNTSGQFCKHGHDEFTSLLTTLELQTQASASCSAKKF